MTYLNAVSPLSHAVIMPSSETIKEMFQTYTLPRHVLLSFVSADLCMLSDNFQMLALTVALTLLGYEINMAAISSANLFRALRGSLHVHWLSWRPLITSTRLASATPSAPTPALSSA